MSHADSSTHEAGLLRRDIFNIECLSLHNNYRRVHQCPHLCYSETLAQRAQVWANHLAMEDGTLVHDPTVLAAEHSTNIDWRKADGENVGVTSLKINSFYEVLDVVSTWYSEILHFNFDQQNESPSTSFFTQLIWASTRTAGFAKARSKSGRIFIVGRYRPTGNIVGLYHLNVPPPANPMRVEFD